jgi:lipopolysaccharide transport system permease protein
MFDNFKDIFRYRALIGALVVRHLSVRYRGSVLGFLWSLLNPLCLMLVYSLVFDRYMGLRSGDHYAIFLFCGLLPWLWITSGLLEGCSSIVSSGHLITKSMFPAQILPTVAVITSMINFLLSLPLLFFFMLAAGLEMHLTLLMLPLLIAVQFLLLLGLSLMLGALNVRYRDVQHVVGNLLTFLFFLCPIIYRPDIVPPRWQFMLDLNPFALITICYHDLILDGRAPSLWAAGYVSLSVLFFLLLGTMVFNHYRESFAEQL